MAIDINNVFGIPCDCLTNVTEFEERASEYYSVVQKKLMSFFNDFIAKMLFGYEDVSQNIANKINNIHYMFGYLYMIRMEMDNEIGLYNSGYYSSISTIAEYAEKYSLECIRKTMACQGIDMMPLYEVFGLNYIINPNDGIGYMAIVPHGTSIPDNRIM